MYYFLPSPLPSRLPLAVNPLYAIRTTPRSFEGDTEYHHRIFAAVLTTKPDSPQLRRGKPKVLSVHSVRNLSTPPFS